MLYYVEHVKHVQMSRSRQFNSLSCFDRFKAEFFFSQTKINKMNLSWLDCLPNEK